MFLICFHDYFVFILLHLMAQMRKYLFILEQCMDYIITK